MKNIGMLGGMSWESTVSYYQLLNREVKNRLGGLHSAKIILHSVDFHEIEQLQHQGQWPETGEILAQAARGLESAGADFLLICTNTMHKVAPQIEDALSIPLLHIADATAKKLKADGISKVGLLGTRFTMEQNFYKGRLINDFGIQVVIPAENDRLEIHRVIYEELCLGKVEASSRGFYQEAINRLKQQGAQAVILGCTEIALLVTPRDSDLPVYDTTLIHALAAVDLALTEND